MSKIIAKTQMNIGLLILRFFPAFFLMIWHGLPKLNEFNERFHSFSDPIGVGSEVSYLLTVGAEFFCAILVMLGVFTRVTVIPILITMLVAAFVVHADHPWSKKEMALLYAIPFLTLIFTGPGKYSLDYLIWKRL